MARCNECNKFVSYGDTELNEESCDVTNNEVDAEVRMALTCNDCGSELKEFTFSLNASIEHTCDEHVLADYKAQLEKEGQAYDFEEDDDPEYEVSESENWEATDRYEDKDKHGKPIKNSRYMKHYFGVSGEVTVRCLKCGEEFNITMEEEEQASSFDDCQ